MATNWSPIDSARVSASASTRAKAPDSCGWATDEPVELGSFLIAASAAASMAAGSAPAACSRAPTVLSGTSSIACSRWLGSAWGLPLVRALRSAAETASRLLVVSFAVSTVFPSREPNRLPTG